MPVDHLSILEDALADDLVPRAADADALRPVILSRGRPRGATASVKLYEALRQLPWGLPRKEVQRQLKRKERALDKQAGRAQRNMGAIVQAWSRSCLARGERLQTGAMRKRSRNPDARPVWQHPRAWTLRGTLREAFRSIGMVCSDASGTLVWAKHIKS